MVHQGRPWAKVKDVVSLWGLQGAPVSAPLPLSSGGVCSLAQSSFLRLQSQHEYFLLHHLSGSLVHTHIFLLLSPLISEFCESWDYAILFQNHAAGCMAAFQWESYERGPSDVDEGWALPRTLPGVRRTCEHQTEKREKRWTENCVLLSLSFLG